MNDEYEEIAPPPIPFAGRESVFAQIQQYLLDPADRHALVFLGQQHIGKSAILQHFNEVFDKDFVSAYFPLSELLLTNEHQWLNHLIDASKEALIAADFSLTRLPEIDPENDNEATLRDWIEEEYLPAMLKLIRQHRRLVWLLDDAQELIEAILENRLPSDSFQYLHSLLESHSQLGIVLTVDLRFEEQLEAMHPLVKPTTVQRLGYLPPESSAALLVQFLPGLPDESQQEIYRASGGQPRLLHQIGAALANLPQSAISMDDVKTAINTIYQQSDDFFREQWQGLQRNERYVLTAISHLLYNDPIGTIDTARIAGWLIETDQPLDSTGINVTLRSLEYQEMTSGGMSGIQIRSGMMQRWLLENARMDDASTSAPTRNNRPILTILLLGIIAGIVLMIIILLAGLPTPPTIQSPALPTVTLEG